MVTGFRVGCMPVDAPDLMERAVAAAADAEVAVVVVGTNDEWETEGRDRDSLGLPGEQDELVRRVAAANPRTVVVVNTGSPVELPWVDDVAAVLHVSFGGQEMGEAVVDVLTGADRSWRAARDDVSACGSSTRPAFTSFAPREPRRALRRRRLHRLPLVRHAAAAGAISPLATGFLTARCAGRSRCLVHDRRTRRPADIELAVTNAGDRAASDVVQCYVVPLDAPVSRPQQELKAFAKAHLAAGERSVVRLSLDDRAFSYWHTGDAHAIVDEPVNDLAALGGSMAAGIGRPSGFARGWLMAAGEYDVVLARSAADPVHRVRVRVEGAVEANAGGS